MREIHESIWLYGIPMVLIAALRGGQFELGRLIVVVVAYIGIVFLFSVVTLVAQCFRG